jgi:hypothetical protein
MERIAYQKTKIRWFNYFASASLVAAIVFIFIPPLRFVYLTFQTGSLAAAISYRDTWSLFPVALFLIAMGMYLIFEAHSSSLGWLVNQHLKSEKAREYDGPFYLLLQPFSKREIYETTLITRSLDLVRQTVITRSHNLYSGDLTLKIQKAIQNKIMLVAVGGHVLYQDILTLNSSSINWQRDVEILAHASRAILLLPETSSGIMAEMKLMSDCGVWQKTVMIMPPLKAEHNEKSYGMEYSEVVGQSIEAWERMKLELLSHSYKLPDGVESGMVFTINQDLSANQKFNLSASARDWGLADALGYLQQYFKGQWQPLKEVYPRLEAPLHRVAFGLRDVYSNDILLGLIIPIFMILMGIIMIFGHD